MGLTLERELNKRLEFHLADFWNTQRELSNTRRIIVTDHAFERWNERIGPQVSSPVILRHFVNSLVQYKYRIILSPQYESGKIDGDIFFSYAKDDNGDIVITTFYGRLSLNPVLQGINCLNEVQSILGDRVNLDMNSDTLYQQEFPLNPDFHRFYSDGKYITFIEKYDDQWFILNRNKAFRFATVEELSEWRASYLVESGLGLYQEYA